MYLVHDRLIVNHFKLQILIYEILICTLLLRLVFEVECFPQLSWIFDRSVEVEDSVRNHVEDVPSAQPGVLRANLPLFGELLQKLLLLCSGLLAFFDHWIFRDLRQSGIKNVRQVEVVKHETRLLLPAAEVGAIELIQLHEILIHQLEA